MSDAGREWVCVLYLMCAFGAIAYFVGFIIKNIREIRELDAMIAEAKERHEELKDDCRRKIKEYESLLNETPEDYSSTRQHLQDAIDNLREVVER